MKDTLLALSKINKEIVAAYRGLKEEAEKTEKKGVVPTRKGRPPNLVGGTTRYLGSVYKRITNKRPARCVDVFTGQPRGGFYTYLKDMFNALNISANADHQLRLLVGRRLI